MLSVFVSDRAVCDGFHPQWCECGAGGAQGNPFLTATAIVNSYDLANDTTIPTAATYCY
jgi:hypothetical protein